MRLDMGKKQKIEQIENQLIKQTQSLSPLFIYRSSSLSHIQMIIQRLQKNLIVRMGRFIRG